jgi:hypothetical protein
MNKKCLETKTFTNNAKTNNFSIRKTSFSFSNLLRYHAVNIKDFRSHLRATYTLNALQKLMQKDFFLATDATTQSSNQEENETREKKKIINCKMTQQRKNADKHKTERTKIKLWPKAQITKESEQRCEIAIKKAPILTLV